MMSKKVLVAVIAYNEERNIKSTIQDLLDSDLEYDIVLIDNGSLDSTVEIAREMGIPCVSHFINSGASSGTLMTYFNYAYRYGYDILCQFDGDGQHIASELPKIVQPIVNGEADYVIGSRFIEKEVFQSYALRRMGIKIFSIIDSMVLGMKVTDITSGARAYNKNVIEFFGKKYHHEVHDTNQLLLLSYFAGARVKEVPVVMKEREHGASEFNIINALGFPAKGVINIIGTLLQRSNIKKGLY
jgi:glycosyltransferase involved in cell wall biosynthesis